MLSSVFHDSGFVLEIGSGTGQHAVFFAEHLPHLQWQPSDRKESLAALSPRVQAEAPANLLPPLAVDVLDPNWTAAVEIADVDAIFAANTLHIMSWGAVEAFFSGAGLLLESGGIACIYGPFFYSEVPTAASNEAFDQSLRARDSAMGIRDFEAVDQLASRQGLILAADHEMPANNRLLVWQR